MLLDLDTVSARRRSIKCVVFIVTGFLQIHTCTNAQMKSTRAVLSTSHIVILCRYPRSDEIRTGEVCVPAGGEWQGAKLELFATFRKKRAGRSGILCFVSGTDKDGRHDFLHEITRHGRRVSCHQGTCPRAQQAPCKCAARFDMPCRGVIALRFARTALRDGPEWNREEMRPRGATTFTRSPRCAAAHLCYRSAKHACSQPVLVTYENITRQTTPSP